MQTKPKPATERLFHVLSFQSNKWTIVNDEAVPRPAAALLVAAEWAQRRKARAVPTA